MPPSHPTNLTIHQHPIKSKRIRAGKERGVASTKAYTSQLASIVILAVFLARQRGMTMDTGQKILAELESLPAKIEQIL